MPIGKFLETAASIFGEVEKNIDSLSLTMSLDQLLNIYGDNLDKIIIREEQDKKCSFLGGELNISRVDEKHYECAYALYFEDADESVHAVESKSKPLEMQFLTEDFQKRLNKESTLKFEIDEPSEKARKNYEATKPRVQ